jgi:hypothetical protein
MFIKILRKNSFDREIREAEERIDKLLSKLPSHPAESRTVKLEF